MRLMILRTSAVVLSTLFAGCATAVPPSLAQARAAYVASTNGLAGQLTPTELYDAKKVLDKANAEFDANGDTVTLDDYAYISSRKIELADVKARTEVDRRKIAQVAAQGVVVRDTQAKETQRTLEATRAGWAAERAENAVTNQALRSTNTAQGRELDRGAARLEAEQAARVQADAKLASAMRELAQVAAVREDERGLVITLSGSVLFASGKAALLEGARTRLDSVADALVAQSADKTMSVEGHTDSQGSDATNQPLSMNRASTVRSYLVTRGVEPGRISAVGLGSSHPLLDNRSAENRANNRRVEIIIHSGRLGVR